MLFIILSSIFHQLNYKVRCIAIIAVSGQSGQRQSLQKLTWCSFTVHHPITVHCTLYTVHCTPSQHCTLYTVHQSQHFTTLVHTSLYTISTLYTVHCTPIPTLYTVHHTPIATLYNIGTHITVHSPQHCTPSQHSTLSVHTKLYPLNIPNILHYHYTKYFTLSIYQTFCTISTPNTLSYQYTRFLHYQYTHTFHTFPNRCIIHHHDA